MEQLVKWFILNFRCFNFLNFVLRKKRTCGDAVFYIPQTAHAVFNFRQVRKFMCIANGGTKCTWRGIV